MTWKDTRFSHLHWTEGERREVRVINHIVVHFPDRSLMDRQTLAVWLDRSEETIRDRCEVVEYRSGKAMYDEAEARETLTKVRRRGSNKTKAA